MIQILKWFLWRRWKLKHWRKEGGFNDVFLRNCHNCNLAGCRKHPVIYNDMCRIVRGGK
ncbi:hypothetical protein KLPPOU148_040 [Klebsiella phage vB_KpnM_15-38_KLPPOU148]|uniref:Uncharacterized protein n=1 Tax=Klebsiella phage vB_KpnM_15-38_KLPPOU148 TaxID=2686208 RepID=A0A6B9JBH8_9CAUD|nr:hypothetical protein PQZ55_gp40 [Klebsiella phage vB_KpnM_15-38_KLPPOU148]QGZ13429.1 hypothetical protein KLPPOU148_040 [Klebsiella phage vB_KpnM_15-38_KLPPOU148]